MTEDEIISGLRECLNSRNCALSRTRTGEFVVTGAIRGTVLVADGRVVVHLAQKARAFPEDFGRPLEAADLDEAVDWLFVIMSEQLQQIQRYAEAFATTQGIRDMAFVEEGGVFYLKRSSGQRIGTLGFQTDCSIVTSVGTGANPTRWPLVGAPATDDDLKRAVEGLMDSAKMVPPA